MKPIPFILFVFIAHSVLSQPIVFVTPSGAGTTTGDSWANALPGTSLPARVATATAGTQFWLTAGTYKPTTTTDRAASFSIASGVSVYGGFAGTETALEQRSSGQNETILSGDIGEPNEASDNSSNILLVLNSTLITLDGITIKDGTYRLFGPYSGGCGMYIEGDGVQIVIAINNCRFLKNKTPGSLTGGGAIELSLYTNGSCALTVTNSFFSGNEAGYGGAFAIGLPSDSLSTFTFKNCEFEFNRSLFGPGGALYQGSYGGSNWIIQNCYFNENIGQNGGGALGIEMGKALIANCTFVANKSFSSDNGGDAVIIPPSTNFFNCVFDANTARNGIIASNSTTGPTLTNCTLSRNYSDVNSLFVNCQATLLNCISWSNTTVLNAPLSLGSVKRIAYSLIQNGYPGTGNLDTDPLFVDPINGNFRLQPNSPAIDAGDPNTTDLPATDLAGQPRVQGGRVDIGAYESVSCDDDSCLPFVIQRRQ